MATNNAYDSLPGTNFENPQLHQDQVDIQLRTPLAQSHSQLIHSAVNAITANQENVFKGVLDVVKDHNRKKLKQKTKLRYVFYALSIVVVGVAAVLIDYYIPGARVYLAVLCSLLVGLFLFCLLMVYCRYGKTPCTINWRLRNVVRYMDVCQVGEEYTQLMLPQLGPQVKGICHCQLAGSSGDTFGFFPAFSANVTQCNFLTQRPFTQDVDMNLFYDALLLGQENLTDIGQPGFCWVQIDQTVLPPDSFITDCIVQHPNLPGGLYLSGKLVSEKIGSFIPTDRENVFYNYPAITYKTAIKGPQGKFKFDVDVVFGIKLDLWPKEAREWPGRVANKLSEKIIRQVQSLGCYIVHKHCTKSDLDSDLEQHHQQHHLDWRITFAEAESLLFKHHASKEALKVCYVVTKFTLKHHITNAKKAFPALKSYHLKTILLWLAEEGHEGCDFVNLQDRNLAVLFELLFVKYQEALEKGNLPHYFMPSVNILAAHSQVELQQAIKAIKHLRSKPLVNIEWFDQAWISVKRCSIVMFSLLAVLAVSLVVWFVYRSRQIQLTDEADQSLLDLVGEQNRDLLDKLRDLNKRHEFLRCVQDTYKRFWDLLGIVDIQPAIRFCRVKLSLNDSPSAGFSNATSAE